MLEVTYDFFTSSNAQNALQELYGTRFDTDTTIKISKIKKSFDKNFKDISIKGQAIMIKHAELDDKKMFIQDKTNKHGIKFKEGGYELASKEIEEFLKTKVSMTNCDPISVKIIPQISANELLALQPILSDFVTE